MILDAHGNPIEERTEAPLSGRTIWTELRDRAQEDVSAFLTPAKVSRILDAADSGDAFDQAALSDLILEKNDTILSAFDVRVNALLGLDWHMEPGDDSEPARNTARMFSDALKRAGTYSDDDTFSDLCSDLLKSLISGYALSEIIWGPGGSLKGFRSIPAREIDFLQSFAPRIRVSNGSSVPAPRNKFLFAHYRRHGSDPVRGGLIRPLAWLHCFVQCNIKDLLSFTERYAMPVVIATVTDDKFEKERAELLRMIRNFGPNAGGLVTQGTTLQTIQASGATGDIYLKILDFFQKSVHRLLLGQTASSGDGGGLSKDNAQSEVRQDILESDARYLASVVNAQLAPVWTRFNCPPGSVPPRLEFDVTPPEDRTALAVTVKTLFEAGWQADQKELCDRFGLKLTPREMSGGFPVSAEAPLEQNIPRGHPFSDRENGKKTDPIDKWFGPVARALGELVDNPDMPPEEFSRRMNELGKLESCGDSSDFEAMQENLIYTGIAAGAVAQNDRLKKRMRKK